MKIQHLRLDHAVVGHGIRKKVGFPVRENLIRVTALRQLVIF